MDVIGSGGPGPGSTGRVPAGNPEPGPAAAPSISAAASAAAAASSSSASPPTGPGRAGGREVPVLPPGWPMVSRDGADLLGGGDLGAGGQAVGAVAGVGGVGGAGGSGPGRGTAAASGAGAVDPAIAAYALLDVLFARASVGLALLDRAGRFVRVNDTLARLDRRPAREHLGRTVSEVLGDTGQELDALVAGALRSGEAVIDLEVGVAGGAGAPTRTWSASWFPVSDPQLGPVGLAFVAVDVTGVRAAEHDRGQAEARYRAVAESGGGDVFHATAQSGLDVDLPAWRSVTGQHPGELAGTGWLAGVHPDDRDEVARRWQRALEQSAPFEAEFRLAPAPVRPDDSAAGGTGAAGGMGGTDGADGAASTGGPTPSAPAPTSALAPTMLARVLPVALGESRPVEWLGLVRDLSATRAAEASRAEASQRAEAALGRAQTAESRADAAESRAEAAELRVDTAEQRASVAEEQATSSQEQVDEAQRQLETVRRQAQEAVAQLAAAQEQAGSAVEQASSADQRVQEAQARAQAADERAEAAVGRAEAADRRAEQSDERAQTAESRAAAAERQAEQAADQAAAASQRAQTAEDQAAATQRLADEAARQVAATDDRLEAGSRFAVALAGADTVDEVVTAILDAGGQAVQAQARGVALIDADHDELRFLRPPGGGSRAWSWPDVALGAVHPIAEVVRGGRALFLSDQQELLERWPVSGLADSVAATGEQAWALLPLVPAEGAPIGVVTFGFPTSRTFTPAERAYLNAIAAAAARAVERAGAYDRLAVAAEAGRGALDAAQAEREARQSADDRLDLLTRATATVSAAGDARTVLRAFARLLATEVAEVCAIHLVIADASPDTRGTGAAPAGGAASAESAATAPGGVPPRLVPLLVETGAGADAARAARAARAAWTAALAVASHPLGEVAATATGRIVTHATDDWEPPADTARWLRQIDAHTTVALAVPGQAGTAAVITLTRTAAQPPYTDDDPVFLGELAARAGVALERLERDRAAIGGAARLRDTLRGGHPNAPAGLQVAARYLAGGGDGDAGGEWSDVIDLGAGRVALVIGEARGQGVAATATMGQLRAAARAGARLDLPPGEVLALLHAVVADAPDAQSATCLYAIAEVDTGVLTLASAGHPPPLVVAPDGLVSRLYMAVGGPLGAARAENGVSADPIEYTVRLGQGYLLALFTDGLVRAGGRDADAGVSDLAAVLARMGDGADIALAALVESACAGLGRGGQPAPDDPGVALLFARLAADPVAGPTLLDVNVDGPDGLRAVRAQARLTLEESRLDRELVDVVVLVLSELASNAVRHGRPPLSVRLRMLGSRAVVEVADGGGRLPRRRLAAVDDEAGRGLDLVSRLAVRHGVRPIADGKVVWAEIDLVDPAAG
ncbi:SpoIIE family protein phosphatase [Candidatus Frankia nodulisporulans]|uniref:SpoIIE family protein phosphatase n=1 Tax=Candidatus Frankia nodulisporulans TaxID=2060052 RepID=UPI0013D34A80|nr:SpoIIE family protein phosphatase [Candidatus Frankia nodulisporulans]